MTKALWVFVLSLATLAQQPVRDTPAAQTRMGTASVSGRVVLGDTAATPVRRAVVTLVPADGIDPRSALTDDEGRFVVTGLPAGRYSLTAKKPAHLTSAYGARRPGRPGTTLVVADGQRVDGVEWTLPSGGVLTGRLTLANGEPASNVTVMAVPQHLAIVGGTLSTAEVTFQTDDRGVFRIYGLVPDRYLLMAVPAFGRGEIVTRSDAEYDAAIRSLRAPAPPTQSATGFAPVYFPGTAVQNQATLLTVAPGDIKDGLDFTIATVRMATIRGTLVGVHGGPEQAAMLSVDMVGPALPVAAGLAPRISRPNTRGEFTISNVAPGQYQIRARAGGVTLLPSGAPSTISSAAQVNWALSELTATGDDVDGVRLTLQAGLTFSGRMTAVGSSNAPATWKGTVITVQPLSGQGTVLSGAMQRRPARSASVDDKGTFAVEGLEPGEYEIVIRLPPGISGRWSLASIQHEGRDLRDAPVTFQRGSVTGAEIVLTSQPAELTGTLTAESGAPATDYYVVAFPADRALWHAASPRVRVMRPAVDGLFSTRDLPPGAYRLAALIDVEPEEHRRADFLESIYEAAIAVTVTAGTVTRQDIRIR